MKTYRIFKDNVHLSDIIAVNKKVAVYQKYQDQFRMQFMQSPSKAELDRIYRDSVHIEGLMIKETKKELGLKDKEISEFFGYNTKASYANSSGKVKIENGIVAIVEHMKSQGWSKP